MGVLHVDNRVGKRAALRLGFLSGFFEVAAAAAVPPAPPAPPASTPAPVSAPAQAPSLAPVAATPATAAIVAAAAAPAPPPSIAAVITSAPSAPVPAVPASPFTTVPQGVAQFSAPAAPMSRNPAPRAVVAADEKLLQASGFQPRPYQWSDRDQGTAYRDEHNGGLWVPVFAGGIPPMGRGSLQPRGDVPVGSYVFLPDSHSGSYFQETVMPTLNAALTGWGPALLALGIETQGLVPVAEKTAATQAVASQLPAQYKPYVPLVSVGAGYALAPGAAPSSADLIASQEQAFSTEITTPGEINTSAPPPASTSNVPSEIVINSPPWVQAELGAAPPMPPAILDVENLPPGGPTPPPPLMPPAVLDVENLPPEGPTAPPPLMPPAILAPPEDLPPEGPTPLAPLMSAAIAPGETMAATAATPSDAPQVETQPASPPGGGGGPGIISIVKALLPFFERSRDVLYQPLKKPAQRLAPVSSGTVMDASAARKRQRGTFWLFAALAVTVVVLRS